MSCQDISSRFYSLIRKRQNKSWLLTCVWKMYTLHRNKIWLRIFHKMKLKSLRRSFISLVWLVDLCKSFLLLMKVAKLLLNSLWLYVHKFFSEMWIELYHCQVFDVMILEIGKFLLENFLIPCSLFFKHR